MSRKMRYERLQRLSDAPHTALTIRYARRYLAKYPKHGPAWMLLGIALVELARYSEAEEALLRSLELCPVDKRQMPLSHIGHLFRFAGDYDQAAVWYRRAIEARPEDATYHVFLGGLFAIQGRFPDAEQSHRDAIDCVEGCIDEAYLNLGFVLRAQERFSEAAECFREAIYLDPMYRAARQALRDVELCMKWSAR